MDDGNIVLHRGSGAVVFSDASGFTALTERLAKKANGAELLSQCLTSFFTPLIQFLGSIQIAARDDWQWFAKGPALKPSGWI